MADMTRVCVCVCVCVCVRAARARVRVWMRARARARACPVMADTTRSAFTCIRSARELGDAPVDGVNGRTGPCVLVPSPTQPVAARHAAGRTVDSLTGHVPNGGTYSTHPAMCARAHVCARARAPDSPSRG
jgi:hypothetical protein